MKFLMTCMITFAALSGMLFASVSSAAPSAKKSYTREYGMAGCGLGSLVVGKRGGQIFAATTNGTAWNQTFGITFGTSNCVDSATEASAKKMDRFVVVNKVNLANDIAKGNGETLKSITAILKCSDSPRLNAKLQGNFNTIFPTYDVAPNEITDSIITVILNDETLAQSCKIAG